jgi:hypothetical protein
MEHQQATRRVAECEAKIAVLRDQLVTLQEQLQESPDGMNKKGFQVEHARAIIEAERAKILKRQIIEQARSAQRLREVRVKEEIERTQAAHRRAQDLHRHSIKADARMRLQRLTAQQKLRALELQREDLQFERRTLQLKQQLDNVQRRRENMKDENERSALDEEIAQIETELRLSKDERELARKIREAESDFQQEELKLELEANLRQLEARSQMELQMQLDALRAKQSEIEQEQPSPSAPANSQEQEVH